MTIAQPNSIVLRSVALDDDFVPMACALKGISDALFPELNRTLV
jgi:hypothetical protein